MAVGQATSVRRIRAVVIGRVQGVGYRVSTARAAADRGVVGWVANRSDGAVVLEAQGPAAAVDALVAWCRRGPALASVQAVNVDELAPRAEAEPDFAVRRPDLTP